MLLINRAIISADSGSKVLMLVDEPARTTNPVEGTALVEALLSRLAGKPADGYRFTAKIRTRGGIAVAACDFASAGSTWDERTEYAVWLSTQPAE